MDIKFSTTGIRGVSNIDMTADLALKLGKTFGTFLNGKGTVLVACDTRTSSEMLRSALISGLLSTGVKVVDAGVAPIPALSHCVKEDYDAGVMVTSSHNPPEWNGVKFILSDGVEISEADEKRFLDLYKEEPIQANWDSVGTLKETNILEKYSIALINSIGSDIVRAKKFKVVLDTGNGAQSVLMPGLLRKLGCEVIELHTEPKGVFDRPSEPRPETLGKLIKKVQSEDVDFGVAFDCDGDRCIFVDERGSFVMGDVTGSLFARELFRKNPGGKIITTVSTSKIIDDIAEAEGGEVIKTKVGAKYVGEALMQEKALYGFEENGGNIFPDISFTRDGSATAVKILELIAKSGKSFSGLVAELPKYYQVKSKVECSEEGKNNITKIKAAIDRK
ncbi:MAG: phosphoglucosamine mutase, partial [archaeon]